MVYVKSKVFKTVPYNLDDLRQNINIFYAEITSEIFYFFLLELVNRTRKRIEKQGLRRLTIDNIV